MPAEGVHLTALREARASDGLPAAARGGVTRYAAAARRGAVLLDFPYFDGYVAEVLRYALRLRPKPAALGGVVHEEAAVPLALAVLERARVYRSERLAAVGLGLVSHAALDRALHPLVNALAREETRRSGLSHDAAHREVEKFQSILFHEQYFGRPIMGNDVVVRLVAVPARELLPDGELGGVLAEAFTRTTGMRVPAALLRRMGEGYARHTLLLGSPVGARIASRAEKEAAAPRFLHGAWGRFEDVLARAIAVTVPAIARAWELATADDAGAAGARAGLLEVLPAGSIDPPGHEVELEAPYVIART